MAGEAVRLAKRKGGAQVVVAHRKGEGVPLQQESPVGGGVGEPTAACAQPRGVPVRARRRVARNRRRCTAVGWASARVRPKRGRWGRSAWGGSKGCAGGRWRAGVEGGNRGSRGGVAALSLGDPRPTELAPVASALRGRVAWAGAGDSQSGPTVGRCARSRPTFGAGGRSPLGSRPRRPHGRRHDRVRGGRAILPR